MIHRLQMYFQKIVLSCLIKQVLQIWEEKRILGRMTNNCVRIVNHHPWPETVPCDKNLSPPEKRGNLKYALGEHAGNFVRHESAVMRFVTARFHSDRFCTLNGTDECEWRDFHQWNTSSTNPNPAHKTVSGRSPPNFSLTLGKALGLIQF